MGPSWVRKAGQLQKTQGRTRHVQTWVTQVRVLVPTVSLVSCAQFPHL